MTPHRPERPRGLVGFHRWRRWSAPGARRAFAVSYDEPVRTATGRINQVAAKYGEHAPMAATCCNACRACVQTNLIAGVLAAAIAAAAGVARLVRRKPDATS